MVFAARYVLHAFGVTCGDRVFLCPRIVAPEKWNENQHSTGLRRNAVVGTKFLASNRTLATAEHFTAIDTNLRTVIFGVHRTEFGFVGTLPFNQDNFQIHKKSNFFFKI